jgi:aspartate 1-decarboxylase
VTPVGVPTPQTRIATSATTNSKTGARMVVAAMANQRRQRELRSAGSASVICGLADTVTIFFPDNAPECKSNRHADIAAIC